MCKKHAFVITINSPCSLHCYSCLCTSTQAWRQSCNHQHYYICEGVLSHPFSEFQFDWIKCFHCCHNINKCSKTKNIKILDTYNNNYLFSASLRGTAMALDGINRKIWSRNIRLQLKAQAYQPHCGQSNSQGHISAFCSAHRGQHQAFKNSWKSCDRSDVWPSLRTTYAYGLGHGYGVLGS